jgi:hypothetical protein
LTPRGERNGSKLKNKSPQKTDNEERGSRGRQRETLICTPPFMNLPHIIISAKENFVELSRLKSGGSEDSVDMNAKKEWKSAYVFMM